MRITDLIERLENLRKQIGDVYVESRTDDGDFAVICAVEMGKTTNTAQAWRVFIDA